jgi:hypothetical protein
MPVLPKRSIPWIFVFAIVILAVAGVTGEAVAQVYQGRTSGL